MKIIPNDKFVYNAKDKDTHKRGRNEYSGGPTNPAGPVARIYSVWKIEDGLAYCRSENGLGRVSEETFPVNTLEAYKHPWL